MGSWSLQALERLITEQKLEIDDLKGSITSLSAKAAQDKESLKKATRAQKLRAERFEAAIEKCYAQLREKVRGQIGSLFWLQKQLRIPFDLCLSCLANRMLSWPKPIQRETQGEDRRSRRQMRKTNSLLI